jgi:hypothetical protein
MLRILKVFQLHILALGKGQPILQIFIESYEGFFEILGKLRKSAKIQHHNWLSHWWSCVVGTGLPAHTVIVCAFLPLCQNYLITLAVLKILHWLFSSRRLGWGAYSNWYFVIIGLFLYQQKANLAGYWNILAWNLGYIEDSALKM